MPSYNIVGIDPASVGNIGVAYLRQEGGEHFTLDTAEDLALSKTMPIEARLEEALYLYLPLRQCTVFIEESHIVGKGNDSFQRAIGIISSLIFQSCGVSPIKVAAVSVKSFFKRKTKQEVAACLLSYFRETKDRKTIKRLIKQEKWNATDAIAVAIAGCLTHEKEEK